MGIRLWEIEKLSCMYVMVSYYILKVNNFLEITSDHNVRSLVDSKTLSIPMSWSNGVIYSYTYFLYPFVSEINVIILS